MRERHPDNSWVAGMLFCLFSGGLAGAALGMTQASEFWRRAIVSRGLAIYCPDTGQWAWLGECNEGAPK